MIGAFNVRRALRRRKRALWAAALCSASFATGHYLFGEDDKPSPAPEKPSLLSQYLEAKSDLVTMPVETAERVASIRIRPVETADQKPMAPATKPPVVQEKE